MRELNIEIDDKDALREFQIIRKGRENGYITTNAWNEIILKFQWKEFYKKELELWYENKEYHGLPLQTWLYLNRMKYINKGAEDLNDREILRAFKISGIHIGNSFHSPFYIQQFIRDYKVNSIYDCCGGWGHRLLGAWGINYIYNDINPTTYQNCIDMYKFLKTNEHSKLTLVNNKYFYNNDSAFFTPEQDYEAVFTCPPYWNTEIYSKEGAENLSYEQFLIWWYETIKHSINKNSCKYFAYIINNEYKQAMNDILFQIGLTLEKDIILGSKENFNHFQRCADNSFKGESLQIFKL